MSSWYSLIQATARTQGVNRAGPDARDTQPRTEVEDFAGAQLLFINGALKLLIETLMILLGPKRKDVESSIRHNIIDVYRTGRRVRIATYSSGKSGTTTSYTSTKSLTTNSATLLPTRHCQVFSCHSF